MRITMNGKTFHCGPMTAFQLRDSSYPRNVTIVNGFTISEDIELKEGDAVFFLNKNRIPSDDELDALIRARNSPEVHDRLKRSTVGIAGLGGLGSNIASMLVRVGVGHLVIADMDTVDATNMNRQNYFQDDIGRPKTEATKEILHRIDPRVNIKCHTCKVNEDNVLDIFGECDIVCEAFDAPEQKAMLINTVLEKCPATFVIGGSGMAGYEDSNSIVTCMRFEDLCMCGDGSNEARMGMGLMAPRVNICAGHMANAVVRHIMKTDRRCKWTIF